MRRSLVHNAPGGSGSVQLFRTLGLGLAVGTLLCGLIRFDDPDRWVDLLAASFVGAAPAITLVAFAALPVAAARLGVLPLLMAVPAALLELVLVVVLSRVVVAGLTATLSSRHGQELGGLLITVVIALASGGWSLAAVMAQQLAVGPGPALGAALRALPSGWGAVAVAAAGRPDWPVVAAALAGLVALCGLLLAAWAGLLARTMRRPAGRAPRAARGPAPRGTAWSACWPSGGSRPSGAAPPRRPNPAGCSGCAGTGCPGRSGA